MQKVMIYEVQVGPKEYGPLESGCRTLVRTADQNVGVGDWFHFREYESGVATGRHLAVRVLTRHAGQEAGSMALVVSEPEYVDGSSIHWTQTCGCVWGSRGVGAEATWTIIVQCPTHMRAAFTQKPVGA